MTKTGRTLALALLPALLALGAIESRAGEAFVTRVRGTSLTIDKGKEEGLQVGVTVTVVRAQDEPIIHPVTGENLGTPEIELAVGEVTKLSARAATVRLTKPALLPVRPGDLARYTTLEEKMMEEQEQATETAEAAATERQSIRGEASRLSRNIKSIQSSIRGLERAIADLRRFDKDVVQPQFRSINKDIADIKEELTNLRTTVTLLGSAPVEDIGEGAGEMTEEELEQLRQLIQVELNKLQEELNLVAAPPPLPGDESPMPDEDGEEDLVDKPFFLQTWFLGIIALVGLGFIGAMVYLRMAADGEEDDDDDELGLDDDEDEEDDEVEFDVEAEEEDDIVVEETT